MLTLIAAAGLFDALRLADERVATVAWRLQTANVSACAVTAPLAGFSVQTLAQFAPKERAEAAARFGLGPLPQVSAVVPGSAAYRAGLRTGDMIVAINGQPVPEPSSAGPAYDQTAAVEGLLGAALSRVPVVLTLATRTVSFAGDIGCASAVQLVPGRRFDASADGRLVQVSGALYDFVTSDSELAFVVAHELAHNVAPEAKRADGGAGQREAELAADRIGITMMARAGYDVGAVVAFLERLRRKQPLSWLDGSHPNWSFRIRAAERAVTEARQDRALGVERGGTAAVIKR